MPRAKKKPKPVVLNIDVESNLQPEFKDFTLEELMEQHRVAHEKTKTIIEEVFKEKEESESSEFSPEGFMEVFNGIVSSTPDEKMKELHEAAGLESRLEQEIVLRMFSAQVADGH
jgi:hypothetical protein